jgi:hypothetical protein
LSNASERDLKRQLKAVGLTDSAIDAAWPAWWSHDADSSPSASLELRFSIARKLGIDPRSLLDVEGTPRFIWRDEARFKHLSGETDIERAAISSFGRALGAFLVSATTMEASLPSSASTLRRVVLKSQPFVRLPDLLSLCWSTGIPVIHLRIFPRPQKRMAAMAVRVGERNAILLAKDSQYPAHIAFYLAHELGHLLLGHIGSNAAIVDMESDERAPSHEDAEEEAADRFALELLTGSPEPKVVTESKSYNAPGLATAVLDAAPSLHIEPGTLALSFGYSTNNWAVVNSAMRFIYGPGTPMWQEINRIAMHELDLGRIPEDARSYIEQVLGGTTPPENESSRR